MKRIVGLLLISILLLVGCLDTKSGDFDRINYYLGADDTKYAFLFYDVPSAPPLTIDERVMNIHFDEQNILATSSAESFGWVNEKHSGPHNSIVYTKQGEQLPEGEQFQANGSIDFGDGREFDYYTIYLTKEGGCFNEDGLNEFEYMKQMIETIYGVKIQR
ncbi:hypothetical protein [Solibacillus sp. FSL K6-1523]|uniref:hypothetical protein n=1 Tax=Solibacillus sp. FSL K6-1523 TaxID=2921471 RepID=UPI0030FD129B